MADGQNGPSLSPGWGHQGSPKGRDSGGSGPPPITPPPLPPTYLFRVSNGANNVKIMKRAESKMRIAKLNKHLGWLYNYPS